VLRTLGETLRDQERYEAALAFFDRAIALPGGDPLALLARSFTLEILGRYAEAEAAADQSIAQRAGPAALLRKMECQLNFHGDLNEAIETLAKVPASSLLDDRAISLACQLWFWKRQPEKCLAVLSGATREFLQGSYWNGAPKGWLTGRVHQLGDRPAAAEAHFRTALKAIDKARDENPEDVDLIFWAARVHACLGEKLEAEKMLELARESTGAGAQKPSTMVAAIEIHLGRLEEALTMLEAMVKTTRGPALRVMLRYEPVFDPLRGNPRFGRLLEPPKDATR
jgi:tetratricopeptide (TPR) repeat protein